MDTMQPWRAQLLPQGQPPARLDRGMDFGQMADEVLAAFGDRPWDLVPLLVSDHQHTASPDLTCGYVQHLERVSDGLDAVFTVTPEGGELLRRDRELRAAPQILLDWKTLSGVQWTAALRHVSATHRPLIRGLRGFEEVV